MVVGARSGACYEGIEKQERQKGKHCSIAATASPKKCRDGWGQLSGVQGSCECEIVCDWLAADMTNQSLAPSRRRDFFQRGGSFFAHCVCVCVYSTFEHNTNSASVVTMAAAETRRLLGTYRSAYPTSTRS